MTCHLIIPDVQVKPGHDYSFLKAIGNYIVKKRPDVIINIGDFADMPSLSSYDKGKKSFEGRRYKHDVEAGWEVLPFECPIIVDGVLYAHYVTAGALNRPVGSAAAIISKKHQSCVVGHQQGRQVAYAIRADGKTLTSIIAGSCYEHDEGYMGPQGNHYWRGIVVLHEVNDGCFDEMFVSLDFLKKRYL